MKNFSGKLVVITGAASGIGRALAVQLAGRGAELALADIDEAGLRETAAMVNGVECTTYVVDVADRSAMQTFAAQVVERYGRVDLLINNAGVTLVSTAEGVAWDDFEWIMNVNFWGVVHGTKAFLPHLRRADEAHIVNVSSLFGLMSMPLQSTYNATKFAVRGFTEALKMELAGSGIGVSSVHPGGVKTDIARNARIGTDVPFVTREKLVKNFDRKAITSPEQAAAIIIRGIEKNRRRILVGRDARWLDRVVRWLPGRYERLLGLENDIRRRAARKQRPGAPAE